jgi:hypothetical protein
MRENEIKIFEMNSFGFLYQFLDFYWSKSMNLVWNFTGNMKNFGPRPNASYNHWKKNLHFTNFEEILDLNPFI